jgi:CoA:oxalate CoA-transferase
MKNGLPMLKGYRVLDMTQIVAGPSCTRIMAELGAEVVKIELPPLGDRTRVGGLKSKDPSQKHSSRSTYYFQHNHSKVSVAIDFKKPKGLALLKEMVSKFDVLVENFTPGVLDRAGLSYGVLKEINPSLVMCSISMAGQEGVLSQRPGYDYIAQAYAGITDLIGQPDGDPSLITMAMGDSATGLSAAMGIAFALLHREKTGEGQYIEATLLDTYFQMHEVNIPRISLRKGYQPKRTGSQHPDGGPTGIFKCSDHSYISIATLPHQWKSFCVAINNTELVDDPRFKTASLRRDNNLLLKEIFEDWLATFKSREAAIEALDKLRIPCAPVLTLNEAIDHPHLRERGTVRRVKDDVLGEFDIPGFPVKFSRWNIKSDLKADSLGGHNTIVLKDYLGLSEEEIEKLYDEQVLIKESD